MNIHVSNYIFYFTIFSIPYIYIYNNTVIVIISLHVFIILLKFACISIIRFGIILHVLLTENVCFK